MSCLMYVIIHRTYSKTKLSTITIKFEHILLPILHHGQANQGRPWGRMVSRVPKKCHMAMTYGAALQAHVAIVLLTLNQLPFPRTTKSSRFPTPGYCSLEIY